MGCRCNERKTALRAAVSSAATGNVAGAARQVGFVARTLGEDARSGDLRRAAAAQLARLGAVRRP